MGFIAPNSPNPSPSPTSSVPSTASRTGQPRASTIWCLKHFLAQAAEHGPDHLMSASHEPCQRQTRLPGAAAARTLPIFWVKRSRKLGHEYKIFHHVKGIKANHGPRNLCCGLSLNTPTVSRANPKYHHLVLLPVRAGIAGERGQELSALVLGAQLGHWEINNARGAAQNEPGLSPLVAAPWVKAPSHLLPPRVLDSAIRPQSRVSSLVIYLTKSF